MKFSAIVLFVPLWADLRLFPDRAHGLVLGRSRATIAAGKAVADAARRCQGSREDRLDAVTANAGLAFQWGALDFAGGTVVHINAGIAGLVGALIVGKRVGFGREAMPPHSLTMTLIGACAAVGGLVRLQRRLRARGERHGGPRHDQHLRGHGGCGAGLDARREDGKGKPSLLGGASGAVAGLVAVTPASGFAGPMGAIVLGIVAGFVCMFFCSAIKNALGYDDALDVFGVHCIGGIIGAIGTGILAAPSLGGTGVFDYTAGKIGDYDMVGAGDHPVQGCRS